MGCLKLTYNQENKYASNLRIAYKSDSLNRSISKEKNGQKLRFDYLVFGMLMPDRNGSSDTYRFGFNGKENDDDVYDITGTFQDYGMRMYDPRVGRFVSVDPLIAYYPELTPYQFASNRSIDGLDYNGCEYITYLIQVYDNLTGARIIGTIDYRNDENFDYEKYSQSFGPEGRGVKYIYYEANAENVLVYKGTEWQQKQGDWSDISLSKYEYHGLFYGGGAVTTTGPIFIVNYMGNNVYNFGLKPIDMVDAIAREHDVEENENYVGWKDPVYIFADIRFVKRLQRYLKVSSKKGYVDPYTNKPQSEEAKRAAINGIIYFSKQIYDKQDEMKERLEKGEITKREYQRWRFKIRMTEREKVNLPTQ